MSCENVLLHFYEVHICNREKRTLQFYKIRVYNLYRSTTYGNLFFQDLVNEAVGMPLKLYLCVNCTTQVCSAFLHNGEYVRFHDGCNYDPTEQATVYDFESSRDKEMFFGEVRKLVMKPKLSKFNDETVKRIKLEHTKKDCDGVEEFLKTWAVASKLDPFFEEKKTAVVRRECFKVWLFGEFWKDEHGDPHPGATAWLEHTNAIEKHLSYLMENIVVLCNRNGIQHC